MTTLSFMSPCWARVDLLELDSVQDGSPDPFTGVFYCWAGPSVGKCLSASLLLWLSLATAGHSALLPSLHEECWGGQSEHVHNLRSSEPVSGALNPLAFTQGWALMHSACGKGQAFRL